MFGGKKEDKKKSGATGGGGEPPRKEKKTFFDKAGSKFSDLVSKGHVTEDSEFDQLQHDFNERKKNIDIITSDVTGFMGCLDALLASQSELSQHMNQLFPSLSNTARLSEAQNTTIRLMGETKTNMLDPLLREHFHEPIKVFLVQFREISDRIRERQRRCAAMDKLITQVEKYKKEDSPKLAGAEVKLGFAAESYNDMNDEVKKDIPILLGASAQFFYPVLQNLIYTQSVFWLSLGQHAQNLAQQQQIYGPQPTEFGEVITPKNVSATHRSYAEEHNPWGSTQNQNPYGTPPPNDPWGNPQGGQGGQRTAPPPPSNQRSAPPPPGRSTQSFPVAKGMWAFTAENPNEISFNAGDSIEILEQNGDWWKGRVNGKEGLFPANYVKLN